MITQERLKELFEYEEDTGRLRRIKARGRGKLGNYVTAMSEQGYLRVEIDNKNYLVHRLVYLYHFGEFPKLLDHINTDKLDNRLSNLREATSSQNLHNTKKRKTNTSGVKGLIYSSIHKAWIADIMVDYKRVAHKSFKGSRDDESIKQEAVTWLIIARQQHHGEFTNHG
jgi:hypothetical protein